MKKYYAITTGSYSSYHIIAITDSEERANNLKKIYGNDTYIEEYFEGGAVDEGYFYVCAHTDGTFSVCAQTLCDEEKQINKIFENTEASCGWIRYSVNVFARDANHAIKVAQDLWAEYKAKKEGIV